MLHQPALARAAARPERRPILVTGAPRSGSTWVGNILALDAGSGYVHEPFNKRSRAGQCRARFAHAFTYVTPETEAPYLAPLADTLAWRYSLRAELERVRTPRDLARLVRDLSYFETMRRRRARVILKDPLAVFSAAWLAHRFDAAVVVVLRHPAAFVASLRAAGWHRVRFAMFTGQPRLMAERLAPLADEIEAAARRMPDAIAAGALLWKVIHHHIRLLRAEHPDWIFVRHEDLSRDPIGGFRALYARLGLDFTPAVARGVAGYSGGEGRLGRLSLFGHRRETVRDSAANLHRFRERLTPDEIERIRHATTPLADAFYTDADW